MGKYVGKNDLERGSLLEVIKRIDSSYGVLEQGSKVTLIEVTHFPTSYRVIDQTGKSWTLRTYDVKLVKND